MATGALTLAAIPTTTPAQHQSFLDKVKGVEHSFLAFWAREFAKFQKAEPKIQEVLDALAKYGIPALDIGLAAAGGPAAIGATAAGVIAEAQTGLTVASSLVNDFGPTPTAASVYSGIQSNLSSILALDQVKNPTTQKAITTVVNLVGSAAQGIAAAAAPAKSQTVNSGSAAAPTEAAAEEAATGNAQATE